MFRSQLLAIYRELTNFLTCVAYDSTYHHHHITFMELGHMLIRSGQLMW